MKFTTTGKTKKLDGRDFFEIKREVDGLIGGFLEDLNSLSQKDDCFVYEGSFVYKGASIKEDLKIKNSIIKSGTLCGRGTILDSYIELDNKSKIRGVIKNSSINQFVTITSDRNIIIEDSTINGSPQNRTHLRDNIKIINSEIISSTISEEVILESSFVSNSTIRNQVSVVKASIYNSRLKEQVNIKGDKGSIIENCTLGGRASIIGMFEMEDVWATDSVLIKGEGEGVVLKDKIKLTKNCSIIGEGFIENEIIITDYVKVLGDFKISNYCKLYKDSLVINSSISDNITLKGARLIDSHGLFGKMTLQ